MARLLAIVLGALGVLGRAAAADQPPRPMMISEAKLPDGFPGPGPVGSVIVKDYPAYRLARTSSGRGDGGMFMRLFRHIERHEVAMTAPVEMTLPAAGETAPAAGTAMAFLYANPTVGTPGPDPADADVVVEDVPALTVASVGVRGGYGPATFTGGVRRVEAWLGEHPEWVAAGPPRALAYNSPFVPGLLKYSEVQVPIVPRPREAAPTPAAP